MKEATVKTAFASHVNRSTLKLKDRVCSVGIKSFLYENSSFPTGLRAQENKQDVTKNSRYLQSVLPPLQYMHHAGGICLEVCSLNRMRSASPSAPMIRAITMTTAIQNNASSVWDPLTYCSLMDFSSLIYWKSSFAIKGVLGVIF